MNPDRQHRPAARADAAPGRGGGPWAAAVCLVAAVGAAAALLWSHGEDIAPGVVLSARAAAPSQRAPVRPAARSLGGEAAPVPAPARAEAAEPPLLEEAPRGAPATAAPPLGIVDGAPPAAN